MMESGPHGKHAKMSKIDGLVERTSPEDYVGKHRKQPTHSLDKPWMGCKYCVSDLERKVTIRGRR